MNAPLWVRCPACGERARGAKTKDEGSMRPVQLRNGALLYECSAMPSTCSLRLGVFSIYVDDDGEVTYEGGALEERLDIFLRYASEIEAALAGVRENPVGSRHALGAILTGLHDFEQSAVDLLREIP